jgi:hypothetical protein
VALVRTDVSEERIASIIRVIIDELGTLANDGGDTLPETSVARIATRRNIPKIAFSTEFVYSQHSGHTGLAQPLVQLVPDALPLGGGGGSGRSAGKIYLSFTSHLMDVSGVVNVMRSNGNVVQT